MYRQLHTVTEILMWTTYCNFSCVQRYLHYSINVILNLGIKIITLLHILFIISKNLNNLFFTITQVDFRMHENHLSHYRILVEICAK